MNQSYYWASLLLAVFLMNSYKTQHANLIDTSKEIIEFSKFSENAKKQYKDNQQKQLNSQVDQAKDCPFTASYVERILRRLAVFSELTPFLNLESPGKERSFTLRMACGDDAGRRFIQQDFGVLNFGVEFLPMMKSEDQLAALLSLELSRFLLGYDYKEIEVKSSFFKFVQSSRVIVMKRNMVYDVDSLAIRILANAGYDAFALIEIIDVAESFYVGRDAPISIGMGKADKRRAKLQDILVVERIGPARQVDGAILKVKTEIAETEKNSKRSVLH